MKNLKSYIQDTKFNFTSQEEFFFEDQLLSLTIAERASFNGYLFYSNLYPTIKASHKTIAKNKISKSSQLRATKKFKSLNLIKRIKTHHRRPFITIVNPIIYNLQFRKRMSKYFPLFKYLPETLLFSLSISSGVFNTNIAKESIDTPFKNENMIFKSEMMNEVNYKVVTHKSLTSNRKLGEKRMLQLEISPVLSNIAEELKLTDEQITRLSEYTDTLLTHAYKYAKDKTAPYSYLLKVCVQEVGNPRFKQSATAKGNDKNAGKTQQRKEPEILDEAKLQELADYYGFDELNKKVTRYEKCLLLAKQTYEKYPTPENERWFADYERGLTRWQTILNFLLESDLRKANESKQPNIQSQQNRSTNSNVVQIDNNDIDYSLMEEDFSNLELS